MFLAYTDFNNKLPGAWFTLKGTLQIIKYVSMWIIEMASFEVAFSFFHSRRHGNIQQTLELFDIS